MRGQDIKNKNENLNDVHKNYNISSHMKNSINLSMFPLEISDWEIQLYINLLLDILQKNVQITV